MAENRKIKNALVSVYYKDGLDELVKLLHEQNVKLFSTGGTQKFIESLSVPVTPVESLTAYPSILGGRVKTLHPKVFGGILSRRDNQDDDKQLADYDIPEIDLVIVDLYPFEETVLNGGTEPEIIEKIDIGGISLIRAAAKNFRDVLIVSNREQYEETIQILKENKAETSLEQRKAFAMKAFDVSSHYDTAIYQYFAGEEQDTFKLSMPGRKTLRYGENPHQKGMFYGDVDGFFDQLHGKEISYNNLLDIDAAVNLINEFSDTTFCVLKHNNACGVASRDSLVNAWNDALAGDPVSAFGGVLITNKEVNRDTAIEVDKIFFEVIIAPAYNEDALEVLKKKKNRIILVQKTTDLPSWQCRNALNGLLVQDKDAKTEEKNDLQIATEKKPSSREVEDMLFANKIVKQSKSNTIVLAKNGQLCASGVGQTSRVDALKQAIEKAGSFKFDLKGAVMASDAFFPFPDCVEIADKAGITAVIQPGGSIRDKDSIDFCNEHQMAMVLTGIRHFKH